MKRILLTGASGFIGRHTALAFGGSGDEVHTIHHRARQMSDSRNHTVDLMDAGKVAKLIERVQPTHLLHLAWYAEHGKFWTSPLNLDWVSASLKLFQLFAENGGQRAVFAGSCAEYDWANSPLHEQTSPSNPNTLYGTCKNALRLMIESIAGQANIPFAWGRIFFLYGPDEAPARLVPSILAPLQNGQPAIVRSGGHMRNLMHVEDVARAFVHILNSRVTGIVNVASKESVSLGDVARMLGEMTGRSDLVQVEQAPGTPQNPQFLLADTAKLHSLGFVPKYSLRTGLATLIENKERS